MTEHFQKTVLGVVERILRAVRADAELQAGLRTCAEEVLALTTDAAPSRAEVPAAPVGDVKPVVAPAPATAASPPAAVPPPPVTPNRPTIQPRLPNPRPAVPFTLEGAQKRLRLKAEAAGWAAERSRMVADGADLNLEIRPRDTELFRAAKQEGCYLWMLHPTGPRPQRPDHFDLIAASYENLAEALALAERVIEAVGWDGNEIAPALELIATSQSALLVAVNECGGHGDDDQRAAYRWLKQAADEHGVIPREGMTLDAPTDPSEWAAVAGRIHHLSQEFDHRQNRGRKISKLLSKVRHKASVVLPPNSAPHEAWAELVAGVNDLVLTGLAPSNKELRDILLPVFDRLREWPDQPDGFRLVVRAVETFINRRSALESPASGEPESAEVQLARQLLTGRSVVMIGGDERPDARTAVERAFGLKELVWIGTSKHDSYKDFEPFVARPDVAVVLLAVRWASHSYGEVDETCRRYGKPLVWIPGGYNPNQLAYRIVEQAGERLKVASPS
ncbi:DUF2325 domain-containing protein [Limnoglobus roseus]|uniref:DUF2325 domain-containing protein n=1 Tax=Limnoglobus roseus TaxID=2598579 RepID=A0A5C1AJG9_9BACT|nr:DUF2325 domain-containing protein [Limnoglobus roseus]QEL17852.1 hypothetical protein PX52LOC_04863 [Limnoglobus roseus]